MRRPQVRRDLDDRGLDEERGLREPILTEAEIMESAARRITNGLVIGAAIIGLAIWAQPSPSEYQGFASKDGVIRLNLESGSMIECKDGACTQILRPGQRLLRAKATAGSTANADEDVNETPVDPAPPAQKMLPPPETQAPTAPAAPTAEPRQAQPAAR